MVKALKWILLVTLLIPLLACVPPRIQDVIFPEVKVIRVWLPMEVTWGFPQYVEWWVTITADSTRAEFWVYDIYRQRWHRGYDSGNIRVQRHGRAKAPPAIGFHDEITFTDVGDWRIDVYAWNRWRKDRMTRFFKVKFAGAY